VPVGDIIQESRAQLSRYTRAASSESARCFLKAVESDPSCAMAHWGIANAAGPNYNKQWKAFDPIDLKRSLDTAHDAAKRALELVDGASSVERALIHSLVQRYPSNDPEKVTPIWNDNYANFMREVYCAHPDDHDIAALFAEAIMNQTPWQLWDIKSGKPANGADTLEAIARSRGGHGPTGRHAASGSAPHVYPSHGNVAHSTESPQGSGCHTLPRS